tara:strand:- start:48 stop:509 length:462 start_codon:yes stop_codon:yes gene_type:complete
MTDENKEVLISKKDYEALIRIRANRNKAQKKQYQKNYKANPETLTELQKVKQEEALEKRRANGKLNYQKNKDKLNKQSNDYYHKITKEKRIEKEKLRAIEKEKWGKEDKKESSNDASISEEEPVANKPVANKPVAIKKVIKKNMKISKPEPVD